jgi:hypothetical protein
LSEAVGSYLHCDTLGQEIDLSTTSDYSP